MDIFTTALTRVVPVPIKPKELKVKALVKEARTRELEQEMDHLEHAGSFFIPGYHPEQNNEHSAADHNESGETACKSAEEKQQAGVAGKSKTEKNAGKPEDEPPHLDIFV
ncbi:hypothetical protein [Thalassomonas actiniarum]|uniref:Uncharacterized protein n=1 Tax=Thalassomonas actiniarum TaxID=485447 RepID=A0AAE9YTP7_9GAMM|nr:hypothetical protein [Thalassomonas actiniarum]WDE00906.1 hypothetical protein SG35_009900 [Thalassomonas actiniarum]